MKKIVMMIAAGTSLASGAFAADPANSLHNNEVSIGGGKNITAQDQPVGKDETELVAQIRRALVAQDTLSTKAQNVVIVAEGPSKVFLRGEVISADEKSRVIATAKKYAMTVEESLNVNG